ncbi:hypothetical protein [Pseudomonas coronafaciens]|uniref:hypothetical protein n=1 Tax=Pseudomonas coronafaciens TaxID=53409 RepID=UPI0011C38664|nr:hypothetical protein [Pseudomonas coronafaciens]
MKQLAGLSKKTVQMSRTQTRSHLSRNMRQHVAMSIGVSDPSDIKLNARALVSWALIVLPKPTASVPNDSSVPYVFLK